jgi:predicted dehydrogenase
MTMSKRDLTRRTFLMGSLAVTAGCATTSGKKARYVSPNEKLNVAAIGAGGKGGGDIRACSRENIVALCDVDDSRAVDSYERFPDAKTYRDFRVMLDKHPEIDACTVSTPDHTHAVAALACIERGIHVYVQKPLTHNIREADLLLKAARKYGVATQMGNQGHCGDGVRQMCEIIWSGAVGQIHEVHIWTNRPVWPQGCLERPAGETVPEYLDWDLWLSVAPWREYNPAYVPFKWRGWWDYGTGALGDMGCHIMDPAFWALNLRDPLSVECVSQECNNEETGPKKSIVRYEFGKRGNFNPCTVYWYEGGNKPPRPAGVADDVKLGDGDNGSLFMGEGGILTTGTYGGDTRPVAGDVMDGFTMPEPTIPRIPGESSSSQRDWLQACKGGVPACSNFEYSVPLTKTVLLGNLALRSGQKCLWDAENMKCTNVPEANQYVTREYRKNWAI